MPAHSALIQRRPVAASKLDEVPYVARKINGEIVVLLGWAPAILLQFAHPLVAAGVAEHSAFIADPRQRPYRLRKTLEAMLALTFGTPDDALRAAQGINAIHDRVNGRLREAAGPFPAGTEYSAHDPELLRWVHATLMYVLPRTYELYIDPLTPAEKDRYCAEASRMGPLLGMPDGLLATNMADLHDYVNRMLASDKILVSRTARELARELVWPPLPRIARPMLWLSQLPTFGLLPPSIRAAYGFPWDARRAAALRITARLTRRLLQVAPARLRRWPAARRVSTPSLCSSSSWWHHRARE
jgi:uncharacterized protein (DUF2236 family)